VPPFKGAGVELWLSLKVAGVYLWLTFKVAGVQFIIVIVT
jgi:hypothetical protein